MLGDTRSDLIAILAIPLGRAKAESTLTELEDLIRRKAIEGVNEGIENKMPFIRAQVQDEATEVAKPLFVGAAVAGGLGALLGVAALIRAKRCAK